ncbi:response regulator [Arcobacteraceae bacterium]|nr:response regulator [Arcobacteraceae bacterium]
MNNISDVKYTDNEISVLIVEDEIVLAMSIELSLKKIGFYVSGIETTADDAITHVQNNHPDIILMDVKLDNESSGIDAANIIWKRFQIPIVFLTSYTNDKTMKKAMECEPYGYLIKPCRDEELKITINMAIHKHRYFFENKDTLRHQKSNFLFLENNLKFDISTSILYKDEAEFKLTKTEKKLFEIITKYPDNIVSFKTIYAYLWREDFYDMGKLRTLIYRLRIKLGSDPFENMYEQGYKIKVIKEIA